MNKIKIYIIDDEKLICQSLKHLFNSYDNLEVIGTSTSGFEALDILPSLNPDIVLVDIRLDNENGIDITKLIKSKVPDTRVVVLSQYFNDVLIKLAMKAGASGYLVKSLDETRVSAAIAEIIESSDFYVPEDLACDLENLKAISKSNGVSSELTTRERDILFLIAKEYTTKDIAKIFNISEKTVRNHKSSIMKKLHLTNDAALIKFAYQMAMI